MNFDLNQIISAALNEAVQETLKPVVYEITALRQANESLREQVKTLQNQASCIDRDLTEAQNQINCLKEDRPTAGVDYSGESFVFAVENLTTRTFERMLEGKTELGLAFQEAVEAVADRRIEVALERFTESAEFSDAATNVADERINRKLSSWTDLPEFEEGIKEVVKEWFEDEIEVKDLIEPAVELINEDLDFEDKIRDALVNNVTLRVVVE